MLPKPKGSSEIRCALILLALLLSSCSNPGPSANPAGPSPQPQPIPNPPTHLGGEIVLCGGGEMEFSSVFHIYRVYADGTGLTQLTNSAGRDRQPACRQISARSPSHQTGIARPNST